MAADVVWSDGGRPVFEFTGRSTARGVTWAWARQDLDMASAPAARAELASLLCGPEDPNWVLVHLGVECFVDLHGLQVLVDAAARVRTRGGELVVVSPPRCLQVMIAVLGLGGALPLAATAQHATRYVRAHASACRTPGGHRIVAEGSDR